MGGPPRYPVSDGKGDGPEATGRRQRRRSTAARLHSRHGGDADLAAAVASAAVFVSAAATADLAATILAAAAFVSASGANLVSLPSSPPPLISSPRPLFPPPPPPISPPTFCRCYFRRRRRRRRSRRSRRFRRRHLFPPPPPPSLPSISPPLFLPPPPILPPSLVQQLSSRRYFRRRSRRRRSRRHRSPRSRRCFHRCRHHSRRRRRSHHSPCFHGHFHRSSRQPLATATIVSAGDCRHFASDLVATGFVAASVVSADATDAVAVLADAADFPAVFAAAASAVVSATAAADLAGASAAEVVVSAGPLQCQQDCRRPYSCWRGHFTHTHTPPLPSLPQGRAITIIPSPAIVNSKPNPRVSLLRIFPPGGDATTGAEQHIFLMLSLALYPLLLVTRPLRRARPLLIATGMGDHGHAGADEGEKRAWQGRSSVAAMLQPLQHDIISARAAAVECQAKLPASQMDAAIPAQHTAANSKAKY